MIARLALPLILAPAAAGAVDLILPVDCDLGQTCFIQQFMDRDPGPAATDFTCGPLSYDGHKGTDFALPTDADMAAGVRVLAAAPGKVRGVRDGMPDIRVSAPGAPPLDGRDCGNGIAIVHAGGWETQYCHLKEGSILVATGDEVEAGQPLGLVGLSGNTEFPHVHLSVRHNGVEVDPFDPDDTAACGTPSDPLWSVEVPYTPGGIVGIGLAEAVPDFAAITAGLPADGVGTSSPALVVWAHYFGNRAGDQLELAITGPDGRVIEESLTLDRTQARAFRAVGRKLRAETWPAGDYTATARLVRDGVEIDAMDTRVTLP